MPLSNPPDSPRCAANAGAIEPWRLGLPGIGGVLIRCLLAGVLVTDHFALPLVAPPAIRVSVVQHHSGRSGNRVLPLTERVHVYRFIWLDAAKVTMYAPGSEAFRSRPWWTTATDRRTRTLYGGFASVSIAEMSYSLMMRSSLSPCRTVNLPLAGAHVGHTRR